MTVLGVHNWPSNAELIEDVAKLHLKEDCLAIDLTYGRGVWWKHWTPLGLLTNDKYADGGVGMDFTELPDEWECLFDLVAYDPPYISMGSSKSVVSSDLENAYGIKAERKQDPEGLQLKTINPGLSEAYRILRCGGIALVKCQDYHGSGMYWPGSYYTLEHGFQLGFKLVDRFEMVVPPRVQPSSRTQRHARRNHSTLFVLKK